MNKKLTGLTAITMCVSLSLLSGCGGEQDTGGENTARTGLLTTDAGVVLEEVGSFTGDNFSILTNQIYQTTENGKILYDYMGRSLGEQYYDISDYNIYSTYQDYYVLDGEDENGTPLANLMTAEGEKIFEEDIEGMITRVNDVYAAVLFATGTTDNEEEVLFYSTTNNMAFLDGPSSGDIMYTGYVQLYSLEKREYIADVTLANLYMDAIGDSVLTVLEDGSTVLFDREGNIIWNEFDDSYYYDGFYFSREANGQVEICDEMMNPLFTVSGDYELYDYGNASRNFVVLKNSTGTEIWLYDLEGNPIFEEPFKYYISGNDDYCLVGREEDGYDHHLFYYPTRFYSEELYDSIDAFSDIPDYAFCYMDGVYTMYNGEEAVRLDGVMNNDFTSFAFTKPDESNSDTYHYYVMQDKDFTLSGEYNSELTDALLPFDSDSGDGYGLYELVTGKQLFDYAYDRFKVAYGYLYAKKDDTYTVYKIQSPFYQE